MSILQNVNLPDFGCEKVRPAIPAETYQRRLVAARDRMAIAGFDVLAVYGDREHFANLEYLSGFDPRFEEALLLLDASGRRKLLVGNECMGYLPDPALGIEVELFQGFSLMGQPRAHSRPFREILAQFGIGNGSKVGCVGWKSYEPPLFEGGDSTLDLPAYMVDLLRDLSGGRGNILNATDLLIGVESGLRIINEPEQIAAFEHAASITSSGVHELLGQIKPGVCENELERHLDSRGLPLTCHRMMSFGEKAARGLSSPSDNSARPGDVFTTAFGVTGALTCRAGMVASGPEDLSAELKEFYPRFAENYFDVVRAWYEALRVGACAGDVYAAAERTRDPALYDLAVNPGHYIHLDEWVHSPFHAGSTAILRSGMALQADIIPVSKGPFCYINAEDGVVLADQALRDELQARYPEMWERICKRREFMIKSIGIRLDESVLPLGNTSGWLPPYALDLHSALVSHPPAREIREPYQPQILAMGEFGAQISPDLFVVSWLGMSAPRLDCHVYVLRGDDGLLLIDCGTPWGHERIARNMAHWGLDIGDVRTVLCTHGHYDHTSGGYLFKQRGVEILGHREMLVAAVGQWAAQGILDERGQEWSMDGSLSDGTRIRRCGFDIEVMHTPGHSRSCLSFRIVVNSQACLFSGDLLMSDGFPGWSGDEGYDLSAMIASLKRAEKVPFEHLCHGHDAILNDRGGLFREALRKRNYSRGVLKQEAP